LAYAYALQSLLVHRRAILSLALGIGGHTAIFQLLDAIRLRDLPVEKSQELAALRIAQAVWINRLVMTRYRSLQTSLGADPGEQQGFRHVRLGPAEVHIFSWR